MIFGGGFAGLAAARGLTRAPVRVTRLDRANHHLFRPLRYHVANPGLAPSDIAEPIRGILADRDNVQVRLADVRFGAKVTGIDADCVLIGDRRIVSRPAT